MSNFYIKKKCKFEMKKSSSRAFRSIECVKIGGASNWSDIVSTYIGKLDGDAINEDFIRDNIALASALVDRRGPGFFIGRLE